MPLRDAKREYVHNVFKFPKRSIVEIFAYHFADFRAFISEWMSLISGRDYYSAISTRGLAIALDGTAQLALVVRRYRDKLQHLGLGQHTRGGIRPGEVLDFELLKPLSSLKSLSVSYVPKTKSMSAIESLTDLQSLCLDLKIDEEIDLAKLPCLEEYRGIGSARLLNIWQSSSLRKLWISEAVVKDLTQATGVPNLESFEISQSRRFVSLAGIENLSKLRYLGLYGLANLTDLHHIGGARGLEYIVIEKCSKLGNIDAIHELPNLKYFEIRGCRALKTMTPFGANPNTTHVFFMGGNRLDQPVEEIVKDLPNLQYYYDFDRRDDPRPGRYAGVAGNQ